MITVNLEQFSISLSYGKSMIKLLGFKGAFICVRAMMYRERAEVQVASISHSFALLKLSFSGNNNHYKSTLNSFLALSMVNNILNGVIASTA